MFQKLQSVEARFEELNRMLMDSGIVSNRSQFTELSKERAEIEQLVATYRAWKQTGEELRDSKAILEETTDREMKEMAEAEIASLKVVLESFEEELKTLMLPKDPNDDKNVIIEIRAGAGGDEAALFGGELFTLYSRYAEGRGWKVEIMSSSEASVGGFKEVIAQINGKGAYSAFKYESGVHRVQRVPATETQGRVHTSTVTVAVLPEAEDVDFDIQEKDLRIDVYRSSGPGGQSVNTTDSAVRVTHIPSGIVVICQDGKSQHKNKAKALTVLRSRLKKQEEDKLAAERSENRRSQIGSGDRSEKIRTYNFPQSRVTDHRIGLTVHNLDEVMRGSLEIVTGPLVAHFRAEQLSSSEN